VTLHSRLTARCLYAACVSLLALVTTAVTGCGTIPIAIAPSTSPLAAGERGTVPAYGDDCQFFLLGVIPISPSFSTQHALEEAKESADAEVLTDVTVDFAGAYYVLFSNNCVRVEGKGVPINERSAAATKR
jgi:hypothetical protein